MEKSESVYRLSDPIILFIICRARTTLAAIKTERYCGNPIVIQGPGAGAEVTGRKCPKRNFANRSIDFLFPAKTQRRKDKDKKRHFIFKSLRLCEFAGNRYTIFLVKNCCGIDTPHSKLLPIQRYYDQKMHFPALLFNDVLDFATGFRR